MVETQIKHFQRCCDLESIIYYGIRQRLQEMSVDFKKPNPNEFWISLRRPMFKFALAKELLIGSSYAALKGL